MTSSKSEINTENVVEGRRMRVKTQDPFDPFRTAFARSADKAFQDDEVYAIFKKRKCTDGMTL